MFLVHVNYLAILLCGILSMVVGFLWYGPLFGKEWMKLSGMTDKVKEEAKKNMGQTYGIMFVLSLVMAWILAHFIWYAAPASATLMIGVKTAFWGWLGLVVPTSASKYLFNPEKKPWKLFYLDAGYYLVTLVGMGVIIVVMG